LHEGRSDVFWGVDLDTGSISIGWARADGARRGVSTVTWDRTLADASRLSAADKAIRAGTWSLAKKQAPVFVYVEQPSGSFNKLSLVYTAGVVQAAIWHELFEWYEKPVEVRTVTSGHWKSAVVAVDGFASNGNFGKPKKKGQLADYPAMKWARANGYEGDDINEVDGMCIAECARRDVRFEQPDRV
jgi:hypothetical protein